MLLLVALLFLGIWDIVPIYYFEEVTQKVYLSNQLVNFSPRLCLGSIVRPLLNLAILIAFYYSLKDQLTQIENARSS
jgi:hypothetical protein